MSLLGGIKGTEVQPGHVEVCLLTLREVVVVWEGACVEVDVVVVDDGRGLLGGVSLEVWMGISRSEEGVPG